VTVVQSFPLMQNLVPEFPIRPQHRNSGFKT
jgi:hypothetical protein